MHYDEWIALLDDWLLDHNLTDTQRSYYRRLRERVMKLRNREPVKPWRYKRKPHDLEVGLRREARRRPEREDEIQELWRIAREGDRRTDEERIADRRRRRSSARHRGGSAGLAPS